MFISNVTNQGLSAAVWVNATRTLTADPATDAGAATLVWTHATRTLTADPATNAGAAALVWGRATGSEGAGTYGNLVVTNLDTNVGSRAPSSTALSTATWTNTRAANLDKLPLTDSSALNQTLAALGTAVLQPAAGVFRRITVVAKAGAGNTTVVQMTDGTNTDTVLTIAAAASNQITLFTTHSVYAQIVNNDGANSIKWFAAVIDQTM